MSGRLAVLAVCDALVESDQKRQARMLSRMYPDMDALNEIEAELEVHESGPYLKWGGDDSLRSSCLGCGYPHSTETQCLRDGSISFKSYDSMSSPGVPPPGASPGGEVESRPETTAPSSPGVDPSGANGSIPPGAVPGEGPAVARGIPQPPAAGQPSLSHLAQCLRDAVGDRYDHCPYLPQHGFPSFPLWHDDHLIDAFDWEGATRVFLADVEQAFGTHPK